MAELEQTSDLLRFRLSPRKREPVPLDFPKVMALARTFKPGYKDSKDDEAAGRQMIEDCFSPEKAREFLAAVERRLEALPPDMKGGPISIVYPRRPKEGQNYLTLVFADKLAATLALLRPDLQFVACHEMYNINPTSRTIEDKFMPEFHIRSRMATATLFGAGDKRKLFIAVDDTYATGNTMLEALSLVHHHGGIVLASATMGIRAVGPDEPNNEIVPSAEVIAAFDRFYKPNSDDRKKLEEILGITGYSIAALNHFEMRALSRVPPIGQLGHLRAKLTNEGKIPELTEVQKAFILFEKEKLLGNQLS